MIDFDLTITKTMFLLIWIKNPYKLKKFLMRKILEQVL